MMRTSTPDRDVGRRRAEEDEETFTGSFSKKTPPKKTAVSDRWDHYTFKPVLATVTATLISRCYMKHLTLFRGTIDGATVHVREVVKRCMVLNSAAIVVCHNHPSGCCEPSRSDKAITKRLQEAVALVGVRLLDHFVIGDGEVMSFAQCGLL